MALIYSWIGQPADDAYAVNACQPVRGGSLLVIRSMADSACPFNQKSAECWQGRCSFAIGWQVEHHRVGNMPSYCDSSDGVASLAAIEQSLLDAGLQRWWQSSWTTS
jgi:hypothetical protein